MRDLAIFFFWLGLFMQSLRGIQVTPLLVTEFLHRVVDVFRDYFNEVS